MHPDRILDEQELNTLKQNHEDLLGLCRSLEELADSLPFAINEKQCREVSDTVLPLLARTQEFEEQLLFPDLDRSAGSCFTAMMIERLKNEHRCDRLAAEEISLTLKAMLRGHCGLTFETIGYMLRGFFECVRRHVAAEKAMIDQLIPMEPEPRLVLA
ncbi:hemerythrin domain-containing protein [Rhizobium sp. KAs_5_22]|uniref:hemerythrin domain-containing protein n=1 Tax=Ciceribacter selenitireducens TaxID=448181 RepID=UPI00048EE001|nr:hemerythrin domain-containing protein [Ciceribacter selenitireducens]PPJ44925.1 hemerythrin domain-containing protein [Rhizobium sp. KAs_5_22]